VQKAVALTDYAKATANGTSHDEVDPRSALNGLLERYVFVRDSNTVHDLQRPAQAADTAMHGWLNLMKNEYVPVVDDGEVVKKPAANVWLASPKRLTAECTLFDPSAERLVHKEGWIYVNSYAIPDHGGDQGWELDDARLATFTRHMHYLIPNEEEREWFVNWLAFTVAQPEKRSKVTPLHISQYHGTGRGWVHELLCGMLGHWNCKKTTMPVFSGDGGAGQFQDYLDRSLVVSIEEVKDGGKRFGVDDRIRDKLEAPRLEVNLKYGGKATISVYANFFLMSNHADALVISEHDRRIQVLTGPTFLQDREYFMRLYRWLDGEGPGQLMWALKRRDLSQFNYQRSTMTEGRARMIQAATTDTEGAFKEWLAKQEKGREFTFTRLCAELASQPISLEDCNDKMLMFLVRSHCDRGTTRCIVDGTRTYPWVVK
jgi:hypothetical protein